jgi:sugar lactone lactonase YvrE
VDLNVGPSSHKVVKKMDISMGTTADIEGNDKEFVFGGKYGYGICNKETGEYRWIKKVWSEEEVKDGKPERMRGNDGAVDSKGRYWVGFMNDPMVKDPVDEGMHPAFLKINDVQLTGIERRRVSPRPGPQPSPSSVEHHHPQRHDVEQAR